MSEHDLQRIEVLTEVVAARRTVASAAAVLQLTARQVGRLLLRYRSEGGAGLVHKARGKPSNRCASQGLRDYTLELVRTQYRDFGPTLAVEALYERHGIKVGRETLRTWMLEAVSGLRASSASLPPATASA